MAEESKPNGTQAKTSSDTSKTTSTKASTVKSATPNKTASTKKEDNDSDRALTLSIQPRSLLPQNRPIEPSSLEIVHTYSSVGSDRPVSKGTIKFSSSIAISGNRPIAASTLQVSDSYVMGNRPVASNESDETTALMGYLD
ncbi:MAG TPA: hypothetical protein V6C71_05890 [Coleofasciculaceae cyanobacterium]|jgi:hypothetical protein